MTYLDYSVFGEIFEIVNQEEKLLSKIYLWKELNENKYEEHFSINEKDTVIILSSSGTILINKKFSIKETIIENNNTKYIKILLTNKFENIKWWKIIPEKQRHKHNNLLNNFGAFDFYSKKVLNYFNDKINDRNFILRFSRDNKMINIVIKNNSIYLLIKQDEINKSESSDFWYY